MEKSEKAEATVKTYQNIAEKALAELRKTRTRIPLRLTFTSPILMHRWGQKAVQEMLSKMTGFKMPEEHKDLTKEFEQSWYRNQNGVVGLPCRLIKACFKQGAGETKKVVGGPTLGRHLCVVGEFAPLRLSGKMEMYTCACKVGLWNDRVVDMRARAIIPEGSTCDIVLEFGDRLTPDQVMSAVVAAGQCIGVCDWRMEKGGEYGGFEVQVLPVTDIPRIIEECSIPEEEYQIPEWLLTAVNAVPAEDMSDAQRKAKALLNGSRLVEAQAE